MSLIKCEHACFAYECRNVLNDISFSVNEGDFLAVVGENGAGKSTLIKGLLRLKEPSSGQIIYGNGLNADEIDYLPQQTMVQKDLPASVYEVVLSGCLNKIGHHIFYSPKIKKSANEKIHLLGIDGLKKRCYRELSGDQQQRVMLARAMCATQKLLVLDEPVTGLDPVIAGNLYDIIREIHKNQNITIILIIHDARGAVHQADIFCTLRG